MRRMRESRLIHISPSDEPRGAASQSSPNSGLARILTTGFLLAACGGQGPSPQPESPGLDAAALPAVVASVDGQTITREELARRVGTNREQTSEVQKADLADYREALQDLIDTELLYQESRARGYGPAEEELNQRLATIRNRFSSQEAFQQALAQQGITAAEMRQALDRDLSIKRYLEKEVISKVSVSEDEMLQYFETYKDQIRGDDELQLRHILIRVPPGASEEARGRARDKLEGIRKEILGGGDFADLAREYSQDPGSAATGGELGWISRGLMVTPFEQAAYALQEKELSPIVETQFGFHLIQVTERRPGPLVSYQDAKQQLEQFLRERQIEEQIGAKAAQLRERAKVEVFI